MPHVNIHNGLSMRIQQRNNPRLLRFLVLSLDNNNKKEKRLEKHLIMIYLLCFKMMCHLVVVNITAVWGLKEPLAYLHVKAAAVFLTMEYFCS